MAKRAAKTLDVAAPAPKGPDAQPVSAVEWVDRNELTANDYNPNRVAPPELRLLKVSILEDGWTQPIVIRDDGEIVDGYHRWMTSADPQVAALTDGMVPVVRLRGDVDALHQRMSTVRHNRARGSHHVVKMADLVNELLDGELPPDEIERRLQMEPEEVQRFHDRGEMTKRGANAEGAMSQAWKPTEKVTDNGGDAA